MLRGYSRHDGISNKQSAKERDRDRQRERQRQERAQMLPNDDKDISTSAHDLFHAPVKVDPSVEDPTTLEIRNTLGNFESVRHILVEGPAGRSLIGVDQNSNAPSIHNQRPLRPGQPGSANKISTHTRNYIHNNPVNSSNNSQNNHKPTQKVPQSQNHLPHHISQSGNTSNSLNSAVNNPPGQTNSVKKPVYNSNAYTNNNSGSVDIPSLNNNAVKVDKNINNNSGGILNLDTVSAENTNEKYIRDFPTRKPALERADSQLELESILKEMMDVTAPITAIQTPAKESPAKKYTPRRPSKSEETIFKTLREGMNVPPPLTDMDSSESSSSDTESSGSDSEDSSSGSQGGQENVDLSISKPVATANSPARWDLSSFMRKEVRGTPDSSGATTTKSPKDGKPRENPLTSSTIDSEESPGEVAVKLESSVTSTSIFGKSMSSSPVESATSGSKYSKSTNVPHATHLDVVEGQYSKVPGKSPRKTPDVKPEFSSKLPPQTIPMKGPQTTATGALKVSISKSLSATSSEDEEKKPKEPLRPPPEKSKNQSGANKRKWRSSPSPEHHRGHKSEDDDSSPEAEKTKSQAVQDENKKNTIMKLFRPNKKNRPSQMDSPSLENEGTKASTGGSASGSGRGKGAKPSAPNRVSAKDSGRKSNSSTTIFVHNGDLDSKKNSASSASAAGKKRESNVKDSATSHSSSHHSSRKRSHKSHSSATSSSHKNSIEGAAATSNANPAVINTNPSIAGSRVKDEPVGKSHPSSLMCRIPLSILLRRPPIPPTTATSSVKIEKESDKGGGTLVGNSDSSHRVRLHYDPSRVGSSSDHASNALHHDPVTDRQRDDPLCSDSEQPSSKSRKRPKKKPRSPKKIPKKLEPDSHSHSKVGLEEDSGVVEVSSNVFGYTSCDSVSVSTTRTPPVEMDIPPAPDSSLNPPHLPSPVVPPQPVYYSFFEKNDTQHHEDYYTRDQDTYLEEAKRLKHKADNEKLSTTQASTYLEAGLYFILTGLSMERDRAVGSQSAFTMYKDTLSLIRYIGTRFRSARADYSNAMEAKIIVLSMRCQSLLSLKLFKIKTRETKDIVQYLADHFSKAPPVEVAPIPNSPQLSTPSPHSPTSSPAGSTGILQHTPSPHPHQNHLHTTVPRSIYSQMYKHYTNTYNLMQAHELWEAADSLVERYHMEEFFVSIDRQYGPLTLHNSLVDLVRYVKHCLKVLKICSDIS